MYIYVGCVAHGGIPPTTACGWCFFLSSFNFCFFLLSSFCFKNSHARNLSYFSVETYRCISRISTRLFLLPPSFPPSFLPYFTVFLYFVSPVLPPFVTQTTNFTFLFPSPFPFVPPFPPSFTLPSPFCGNAGSRSSFQRVDLSL